MFLCWSGPDWVLRYIRIETCRSCSSPWFLPKSHLTLASPVLKHPSSLNWSLYHPELLVWTVCSMISAGARLTADLYWAGTGVDTALIVVTIPYSSNLCKDFAVSIINNWDLTPSEVGSTAIPFKADTRFLDYNTKTGKINCLPWSMLPQDLDSRKRKANAAYLT